MIRSILGFRVQSTTRGSAQYDNLVFTAATTVEFTGRAGVLSMQEVFAITTDVALELSDHPPVWAEFSAVEGSRGAIAGADAPVGR